MPSVMEEVDLDKEDLGKNDLLLCSALSFFVFFFALGMNLIYTLSQQ